MLSESSRVLIHPSLAALEDACESADLGRAILALVAAGTVTGMIGGFINLVFANSSVADIVVLSIITPLRFVVSLLVVQAFLFMAARALGGRGEFATQAYLSTLVFAPLSALSSWVAVLPGIGAFLSFALLLYSVTLTALALRAAHGGRAWRVWNAVLWALSFVGGLLAWVVISALAL